MTRLGLQFVQVLLAWLAFSTLHLVQATTVNVSPRSQPGVELLRMDIEWINSPQSPLPSRTGVGAPPHSFRGEEASPDLVELSTETKSEWQINPSDRRLSIVLQRWSAQANWQLVWEAERDFPVEVRVVLDGSFSEALKEVMKSLSDSDYPLQAVMNAKTRVLRVRHRSGGGL
jgi:hypothetical protein